MNRRGQKHLWEQHEVLGMVEQAVHRAQAQAVSSFGDGDFIQTTEQNAEALLSLKKTEFSFSASEQRVSK